MSWKAVPEDAPLSHLEVARVREWAARSQGLTPSDTPRGQSGFRAPQPGVGEHGVGREGQHQQLCGARRAPGLRAELCPCPGA